jgi:hypothetical protein
MDIQYAISIQIIKINTERRNDQELYILFGED